MSINNFRRKWESEAPFIFEVVIPSTYTFILPVSSNQTYPLNIEVDWGDLSPPTQITNNMADIATRRQHGYAPGTYTVTVNGSFNHFSFGTFVAPNAQKVSQIIQWGTNQPTIAFDFSRCSNMIAHPSLTGVPDLQYLGSFFAFLTGCTNFSYDFTGLRSDNCTNFSYAFYGSKVKGDLSSMILTNANSLLNMFTNTQHADINTINVKDWDVSTIEDFTGVFQNSAYNQPLNWDTSNAVNMSNMFRDGSVFNDPSISSWDVGRCQNFGNVVGGHPSFTQDLSLWNIGENLLPGQYISFGQMFRRFVQPIASLNIHNWDVTKVTNFSFCFLNADNLTGLNLENWDLTQVPQNLLQVNGMFSGAKFFSSGNFLTNGWKISPTIYDNMFQSSTQFDADISNLKITNCTSAVSMLNGTSFTKANYEALLVKWGDIGIQGTIQNGVTLSVGTTKYSSAAAVAGRLVLTGTYGWNITDGGYEPP